MADRIVVVRDDSNELVGRLVKVGLSALLGAAILGVMGVYLARDQIARHQRDLFSPLPLRRLAALGYLKGQPAVDNVLLLRDYLAWEERPLLRKRAAGILAMMESQLAAECGEEI
ncbi:MAG: hypothetical protein V3S56_05590 [Gemmatimonadota bacterium]